MSTYKLYYNNNGTPQEIPIVSSGGDEETVLESHQTLTADLTSDTAFTVPEHTVGGSGLMVYVNGILSKVYTDTTSTTIKFSNTVPSGSTIDVYVITKQVESNTVTPVTPETPSVTGMTVVKATTSTTVYYDSATGKYYMRYWFACKDTADGATFTTPYAFKDTTYTHWGYDFSTSSSPTMNSKTTTSFYITSGDRGCEFFGNVFGEITYNE